jgi:hypothetical protein
MLSARCRDDTVLRWLSYAFDTAVGTGTIAWHTLHSTSQFITDTDAAGGSTKPCGFNLLRPERRKIREENGQKSRENQERAGMNRGRGREQAP